MRAGPARNIGMERTVQVVCGDAAQVLAEMEPGSIDAVVTDPPYGLSELAAAKVTDTLARWTAGDLAYVPGSGTGFMGARWDRFVPPPALWAQVARVLKPGGHALVFAGTRTADLMGISLRLGGFEIRDQLTWVYGSGMPKAKGTLKPGHEPILLARKPFSGAVRDTVAAWGTGLLATEACRIGFASAADEAESKGKNRHGDYGTVAGGNHVYGDFTMLGARSNYDAPGRWPANVVLDQDAAEMLDAQSGTGASRFFYCAKAPATERPSYTATDGTVIRHPTVKPLRVMRWLVRLATPAGWDGTRPVRRVRDDRRGGPAGRPERGPRRG